MDIKSLKKIFEENIKKYDFYDNHLDSDNLDSDNSYDYKFHVKSKIGNKISFLVNDEKQKIRDFQVLNLDYMNIHALSEVHAYYILFNKLEELKTRQPVFDTELGWTFIINNYKILINNNLEDLSHKEIIRCVVDYYNKTKIIYLEIEDINENESDTESEDMNEYKIAPLEFNFIPIQIQPNKFANELSKYRNELLNGLYESFK
jgi:hypothetical protein